MKRVTQSDIAKKVGISRSTVQRALNNSGPVEEEIYQRIITVAKEFGYKVNLAAKQLAQKKPLRLHAFLVKPQNYQIQELFKTGFMKAVSEKDYNVNLRFSETPSDNALEQKQTIKQIIETNPHLDGIILHPIYHHFLNEELKLINRKKIPLISLDSDVGEKFRLAFIGENYYKGGRILGDLLTKILQRGTNIITLIPDNDFEVFQNRLKGFSDIINKNKRTFMVHSVKINTISTAYNNTVKLLQKHKNIGAIFTTVNIEAVAKALIATNREDIFLCGFDLNSQISEFIEKDVINITLFQRSELQAYTAMKTLLNYLVANEITKKEVFAGYDIITRENLDIQTEIM